MKFKKFEVRPKAVDKAREQLETRSDLDLEELVAAVRALVDDDPGNLTPDLVLDLYKMYPQFYKVISKMLPKRVKAAIDTFAIKKPRVDPKKDEENASKDDKKKKRQIFKKRR